MRLEELNDVCQLLEAANPEFHPVTVVHGYRSTVEMGPQLLQDTDILAMLNDSELRQDLPAYPHRTLAIEGNMETTFSINEPDDPPRIQPFLLITCTQRILTEYRITLSTISLQGRGGRK